MTENENLEPDDQDVEGHRRAKVRVAEDEDVEGHTRPRTRLTDDG